MQNIQEKVEQDLKALHIPFGKIESITINPRLKTTLGRTRAKPYRIELSMTAVSNPNLLYTTLVHEYLHTAPGCMNHGPRWKAYAKLCSDALGISIERTARLEQPDAKYKLQCTKCGTMIGRHRMSSVVSHPERYRCKCGGTLIRTK